MSKMSYTIFADEFLLMANILLLISFLQKNMLMFRLILLSSITFFLIAGLRYDEIYLDTAIINSTYIILNIYTIMKIFMKLIPPQMSHEHQHIYDVHFSRFLTPLEFTKLLKYSKKRIYRVNTFVVTQSNDFHSLFLLVQKGEGAQVNIRYNSEVIGNMEEFSWSGIIEYVESLENRLYLDPNDKDFGSWGLDIRVIFPNRLKSFEFNRKDSSCHDDCNITEDSFSLSDIDIANSAESETFYSENLDQYEGKEVIFYEFELEALNELFEDKEDGKSIKNGLEALWLVYLSNFISRSDKQIILRSNSIGHSKSTLMHGQTYQNFYNPDRSNDIKQAIIGLSPLKRRHKTITIDKSHSLSK